MKKCAVPALLLAAAAMFTACNTPAADPDALTILGKKSDLQKPYMTRIFEKYKADTGNALNIISIEDADFETEASARFARGEGSDILMHFHNADLSRFNVTENFLPLNGESWTGDLTDSAKAYCTDKEDRLLGLPFWESSVSGCYYNKKILDSYGMGAAFSQAQFNTLCQALANEGKTPVLWPADGCTWMVQFGMDPIFADDSDLLEQLNANEVSYAEIPAMTSMVQWLSNAAEKGWFGPDYLSVGWDDISEKLSSGEAVMTFIWDTWFYTDFKPGKYTVDDFALMPVFMNTADGGTFEGGNLNMMMVNKNSERKEKALAFLSYCATPDNYNYAFDGISTVSCFNGQNTNIQSAMVTEAQAVIKTRERTSTAATKIVGYSAEDMCAALNDLFRGKYGVEECLKKMDELRKAEAKNNGADGF